MQRLAGAFVVLLLVNGCATREPPRSAMVSQSITGDYGYSDRTLGGDRYEVVFVTPRLIASRDAADAHGLEIERQRAYGLALWRAAQLAQEQGFPAFRVVQDSRNVDVTVRTQPVYPYPYFGGFGFWRYNDDYFWPGYGFAGPAYGYTRTRATGRVTVTLQIEMLKTTGPGDLDTAAEIERLRKAYSSAMFTRSI